MHVCLPFSPPWGRLNPGDLALKSSLFSPSKRLSLGHHGPLQPGEEEPHQVAAWPEDGCRSVHTPQFNPSRRR